MSAKLDLIRAHPILGAGFGGYWIEISKYHKASGVSVPQQAHNDYLELIASSGVLGIVVLIWFGTLLARGVRSRLSNPYGIMRAIAIGASVGLVGVAVHSLVEFGLHVTVNSLVACALIALATVKIDRQSTAIL